jgi:hypothetical protein
MTTILIAGTAPHDHAEKLTAQLSDFLKETHNPILITYTDEETHASIKQYAQGEKLTALKSADKRHTIHKQLSAVNKDTGELDILSNAPLILINPTGYLHKIRKHRQSLRRQTLVLFTQENTPTATTPQLIPTGRKANRKNSPRTRRPKR